MRDNDRHRHDQSDEELFGDLLDEIGTEKSHGLGAAPAAESAAPESPAEPQPSRPTPISLGGAGASALYDPETEQDGDLGRLPSMTSSVRRRGGAPPARRRPSLLALIVVSVILAGAAFLFWPAGRGPSLQESGDLRSVLPLPEAGAPRAERPVSGDVDLDAETPAIVPEQPGARPTVVRAEPAAPAVIQRAPGAAAPDASDAPAAAAAKALPETSAGEAAAAATGAGSLGAAAEALRSATSPAAPAPAPAAQAPATSAPAIERAAPPPPRPGIDIPGPSGQWVVQLGSFSQQDNAEGLVARLRAKGYQPFLQTGGTAGGGLVYRVRVGYFATRDAAAAYAARESARLGVKGEPQHR